MTIINNKTKDNNGITMATLMDPINGVLVTHRHWEMIWSCIEQY